MSAPLVLSWGRNAASPPPSSPRHFERGLSSLRRLVPQDSWRPERARGANFWGSRARGLLPVAPTCTKLPQAGEAADPARPGSRQRGPSWAAEPPSGPQSPPPPPRPAPAGSSPPSRPEAGQKVGTSQYRRAGVRLSSLASPREAKT